MTMVSPWMVRPPTVADAFSSTGLSRTVTVELLLIDSSRVCRRGHANFRPREPTNVTQKGGCVATLLYSPADPDAARPPREERTKATGPPPEIAHARRGTRA